MGSVTRNAEKAALKIAEFGRRAAISHHFNELVKADFPETGRERKHTPCSVNSKIVDEITEALGYGKSQ